MLNLLDKRLSTTFIENAELFFYKYTTMDHISSACGYFTCNKDTGKKSFPQKFVLKRNDFTESYVLITSFCEE